MKISFWMLLLLAGNILNSQQKVEIRQSSNSILSIDEDYKLTTSRSYRKSGYQVKGDKQNSQLSGARLSPAALAHDLDVLTDPVNGQIIGIKGEIIKVNSLKSHESRVNSYLEEVEKTYGLVKNEEKLVAGKSARLGTETHTNIDQYLHGIKVHGGELTLHEKDGKVYMIQGRVISASNEVDTTPDFDKDSITKHFKTNIVNHEELSAISKKLLQHDQIETEMVIYKHEGILKLVWMIDYFHNMIDRETFIVDAHSGMVLDKYKTICRLHHHEYEEAVYSGAAIGSGMDLTGTNQELNIYDCDDGYFLVDASRSMFKGREVSCDQSDQILNGVIMTLDAGGLSPQNSNFSYDVASSANANSWMDPIAVSAHINGARAYEYFKERFGRESITGNGTNIVSFVNVGEADGTSMDNAFWNGEFIFYGNGNQAFSRPLAQALDVAGHEMSHGVIQSTANLVYQGESGALNEHFADVFGVLIEDEDFNIGEDVVNRNVFPTGTLRSMSDPNNGGTKLGDRGWQPAHVNEQYRGREDNGGVHINSGIPNAAFYKFVTDESYGSDINERARIAEQIWYRALTVYLRSTSNFADMRVAILQSAQDVAGANVAEAAARAFDAVGITGAGVSQPAEELEQNPGEELVIWADPALNTLSVSTTNGELIGTISNTGQISRPSITDDGGTIIFVDREGQIIELTIDWTERRILNERVISPSGSVWRNAVISRDGTKVAATLGDLSQNQFDNTIIVYDLVSGSSKRYELFNPTTSEVDINTGGVQYADVMEFDHTGENIIYDAFNQLSGTFGQDLSYWDIGILNVWNNSTEDFTEGNIFKLFSGIPANISIGNPTFSKNSPNILAFDYRETNTVDNTNEYRILGLDRETGELQTIFENNTFGFPSYSIDDSNIIFHVKNNETDEIIARQSLAEDKISSDGTSARIFTQEALWGVYLGTGDRALSTSVNDINQVDKVSAYPNPVSQILHFEMDSSIDPDGNLQIYDLQGRRHMTVSGAQSRLDVSGLPTGMYFLQYSTGEDRYVYRFIKAE